MCKSRNKGVMVIAALPPPLHGQSFVTNKVLQILLSESIVTVIDTSPRVFRRSIRYHLRRFLRHICAYFALVRARKKVDVVYTCLESGKGLVYNFITFMLCGILKKNVYLHHHTAYHLKNSLSVFRILFSLFQRRISHVVGSEAMKNDLLMRYNTNEVIIVGNHWIVKDIKNTIIDRTGGKISIGYISNISLSKGIEEVLQTAYLLMDEGIDFEMILAGPVSDSASSELIREAKQKLGERITLLGPISGNEKDRFFKRIDFKLFPSKYINETHGIVLMEAMAYGVVPLTREVGYVPELIGNDQLVCPSAERFDQFAHARISSISQNPKYFRYLREQLQARIVSLAYESEIEVNRLISMIVTTKHCSEIQIERSSQLDRQP